MKTNTPSIALPLIHLGARSLAHPADIVLLKSESNYTYITLKNGETILSSTTMGVLEKRLKPYNFFRPNRSTVVNLQYLDKYKALDKSKASLSIRANKTSARLNIKISRRRQATFFENLNSVIS